MCIRDSFADDHNDNDHRMEKLSFLDGNYSRHLNIYLAYNVVGQIPIALEVSQHYPFIKITFV